MNATIHDSIRRHAVRAHDIAAYLRARHWCEREYHEGQCAVWERKIGGEAVVTVYQTLLRPLPVNLRAPVQQIVDHYAADVFGGREAELAALDAFLADPQRPFELLVALTGLARTPCLHAGSRGCSRRRSDRSSSRRPVFVTRPPASRRRWICWPTAWSSSIAILTGSAIMTGRRTACAR